MTQAEPPSGQPPAATTIPGNKRRGRLPRWLRWTVIGITTFVVAAVLIPGLIPGCACDRAPAPMSDSAVSAAYSPYMMSDLRNLMAAEEAYFTRWKRYAAAGPALGFTASPGVSVSITSANRTGWAATASHEVTSTTCGVFVGSATAPIAGQNEGEPKCAVAVPSRGVR